MYLVGMLVLLFLANIAMLMGLTNWPQRTREGFAAELVAGRKLRSGAEQFANMAGKRYSGAEMFANMAGKRYSGVENFMDTLTTVPGSAFATAPIGSYDGVNLAASLPPAAQGFRANHPDVPLSGPAVEIGPDNLFYFKNNTVKPECCGSTLSSDGGCVCTTPEQRDFINSRGGNRRIGGADF
jgi:hypothetical protein